MICGYTREAWSETFNNHDSLWSTGGRTKWKSGLSQSDPSVLTLFLLRLNSAVLHSSSRLMPWVRVISQSLVNTPVAAPAPLVGEAVRPRSNSLASPACKVNLSGTPSDKRLISPWQQTEQDSMSESVGEKRAWWKTVDKKALKNFIPIFFIPSNLVCVEGGTRLISDVLSMHKWRIMAHDSWWCRVFHGGALSS